MKMILSFVLAFICCSVTAQIKTLEKMPSKAITTNTSKLNANAQVAINTWIEIYELPNFQGRKVKFSKTENTPNIPFALDKVSIKKGASEFKVIITDNVGVELLVNKEIAEQRINNGGIRDIKFVIPHSISIYEKPNYAGRAQRFEVYEDELLAGKEFINPSFNFSSNNISIELSSPNLLAYLYKSTNDEIPLVLAASTNNIGQRNVFNKIRFGRKIKLKVNFNGILAEIHNNDCKKITGYIKYNIVERDRNNITILTPVFDNLTTAFEQKTAAIPQNLNNINDYWLSTRDGNNERLIDRRYESGKYAIGQDVNINNWKEFIVDEINMKNNNVFLQVFTKLNSAHKGCDLCTDYNEFTGMQQEKVDLILLNEIAGSTTKRAKKNTSSSGGYLVQPGPYRINGVGPNHITYFQFEWMTFFY